MGGAADCAVGEHYWDPTMAYPGTIEFVQTFTAKFRALPAGYSHRAVDAVVDKAFDGPQSGIGDYLKSRELQTIIGPFNVDPTTGINQAPAPPVIQIQAGKRVVVWPEAFAKGKV